MGPCPTGGASEFLIPITWNNWYDGAMPDAETLYTSPTLRGGLWNITWSYLEPVSFRIHRADPTDDWIAQNIYNGFDPDFGEALIQIIPDSGLDPLDATANAQVDQPYRTGLRIGTGIPQEGGECDCTTDEQGTGIFEFGIQHNDSRTDAQWIALGVPETTQYLIRGVRVGD